MAIHSRGAAASPRSRVSPTAFSSLRRSIRSPSAEQTRRFDALQQAAYITRTWGDCYGYLLVATGRAEVMVDPIMNLWDAAAIQPIIEEAGGTFTDWQGNATIHAGEAIATNGLVTGEVLSITRNSHVLAMLNSNPRWSPCRPCNPPPH